ncbi:hypothetical protein [Streptomyces sp. NPDC006446]|uniref:morphogenic membrane protein MmpA n=1 Tax=Streptomyces sp. NPDC006446 TaxID=3154301 RepID=UPI0033B1D9F0
MIGKLVHMTTHRAPKPAAHPTRPVERAVVAALVLAMSAGLAWIGGMVYTVIDWAS